MRIRLIIKQLQLGRQQLERLAVIRAYPQASDSVTVLRSGITHVGLPPIARVLTRQLLHALIPVCFGKD